MVFRYFQLLNLENYYPMRGSTCLYILLLLLVGVQACTPSLSVDSYAPLVSSGRVERFADFPSKHIKPRHVDVWLPDGYSPKKDYPVLYMHDGQMLYDARTTWNKQEWGVDETMSRLIKNDSIRPCIVVGIWHSGATRAVDYFPEKPFRSLPKSYTDSLLAYGKHPNGNPLLATDIQSDAYLRFLVKELKPFIDKRYPTLRDRDNTFVAGSSMGGLVSMYAICEYPAIFGGAACMSTHWTGIFSTDNNPIPGAFVAYLQENLPDPKTHKLYFDYGTATLDALYEPYQKQVDSVLGSKGFGFTIETYSPPSTMPVSQNWTTIKVEGADHSENAWRSRLHVPFYFLLGIEK